MMKKWRTTLFTLLLVGAVGLIFVTTNSAQAAFAPDLVANWTLDEAAGPAYVDDINAYDGTGNGDPDPVAGQVNDAQAFTRANSDGIDVADADDFDWGPYENFTIEFWMKKSTPVGNAVPADNEVIIGRLEGASQWWIGVHNTDGLARFYITLGGPGVTLNSAARVDDGQWHHIVAMRDGVDVTDGEWRLYVDNGAPVVSTPPTGGADLTLTTNVTMGYLAGAFYYEGILDQVAIYTRALTEDEIEKNYNLGLEGLELDDDLPPDDDDDDNGGGGGGSSGCFISTSHQ